MSAGCSCATTRPSRSLSLERLTNLSYAATYVLRWGDSDIKDTAIIRMWRSIFEDLGKLLQAVIAREGTDVSAESVKLLELHVNRMDYVDTGKESFERSRDDAAAYVHWSRTFDPEHTVFDDRFVSVMAEMYPERYDWNWRIRRLEDMQKQQLGKAEGAGEGSVTPDASATDKDGSEGDRASEPDQAAAVLHADGEVLSQDDAVSADNKGKSVMDAAARTVTTRMNEGDEGNSAGPRQRADGFPVSRIEQTQFAYSEEGESAGALAEAIGISNNMKAIEGLTQRVSIEDRNSGGPEGANSVDEGDKGSMTGTTDSMII